MPFCTEPPAKRLYYSTAAGGRRCVANFWRRPADHKDSMIAGGTEVRNFYFSCYGFSGLRFPYQRGVMYLSRETIGFPVFPSEVTFCGGMCTGRPTA